MALASVRGDGDLPPYLWVKVMAGSPIKLCTRGFADVATLLRRIKEEVKPKLDNVAVDALRVYQSEQAKNGGDQALNAWDEIREIQGGRGGMNPLFVDYPQVEERDQKRRRLSKEGAELFGALLQAPMPEDRWLKISTRDPIYVRPCYEKMAALLFCPLSLDRVPKLTYVVKGTPGIGKTTMLYYLLWRCTGEGSPFTAVLFATVQGAFVARKSGGAWHSEPFDPDSQVAAEGGRAIGLVDVTPNGTVEVGGQTIMSVNQQGPCDFYGLHRLVVAASAGAQLGQLLGKNMDGSFPEELFLPVWQECHLRLWAARKGIDNVDALASQSGLRVPRLLAAAHSDKFQAELDRFIKRISSRNVADQATLAKDAHAMLLLTPSAELTEDLEDNVAEGTIGLALSRGGAGSCFDFASARVAQEVKNLAFHGESFTNVLRCVPKAAGYVFEEMVLGQMTHASRLRLVAHAGEAYTPKFDEVCELYGTRTIREGVLYRPKGQDYPAVDACGVPAEGDKRLILIQITKGRRHRRIQLNLVENIRVPRDCVGVLCLYIVPTSPSSLTLEDGDDPLKEGRMKGQKQVQELVLAAPSVLLLLPDDVRRTFEPGMKM